VARLVSPSSAIALLAAISLGIMTPAQAQTPAAPAAPPAAAPAQPLLGPDQLDQLVAPIALYPDALLSEILMASTYPLEVVMADRWASANTNLKGDQLKTAAEQQGWDDSVASLVATPDILSMMSKQLAWTENLGDAVLAQQPDVMDAIQRLRAKAQAQNTLQTTSQQTVSVQQDQGKQVIVIAPAQPDTIYVPYYNPSVVYGPWPYPTYPPYYFPPPGYIAGAVIATGIAFGVGYAVGRWASGGNYWGGGVNWGGNNITINRPINIGNGNNINNGNRWQHNPQHRRGVAYTNRDVQQRFGNNNLRSGAQDRMDFRGRSGNQVLQPGNRPGAGGGNLGGGNLGGANRPSGGGNLGGGNRPGAGNGNAGNKRPGNTNLGGNRPGGGGGITSRPARDSGLGNIGSRGSANIQSQRGRASFGGGGGGGGRGGGGGGRGGGGGGGGGRRR
jgi:Protein of unknown function (DUF3300)